VEDVVALGGGGVPAGLARAAAAFDASPAAVAVPAEAPGVLPVVSGVDIVVVASLGGGAADEGDVAVDGVVPASVLVVAGGLESLAGGVGAGGSVFAVSTLATVEEVSAPNRARYPK
jgi:hypothetical protein